MNHNRRIPTQFFTYCVDLQSLKLWEPLHSLLRDEKSTESIKVRTLWVIGTAVQNNPAAQDVVSAARRYEEHDYRHNRSSIWHTTLFLMSCLYWVQTLLLLLRQQQKHYMPCLAYSSTMALPSQLSVDQT